METTTTTYVHPGRAYCDRDHPGDDAQASQWCRDYHRPQGPRSVAELRRHVAADHTLTCLASGGGRTGCDC